MSTASQLVSQPFELDEGGRHARRRRALGRHRPARGDLRRLRRQPEPGRLRRARDAGNKNVGTRSARRRSRPSQATARPSTIWRLPAASCSRSSWMASSTTSSSACRASSRSTNYSWAPYSAGPDGLVIPLPKHFKGARRRRARSGRRRGRAGEGFRIVRPLAAGRTDVPRRVLAAGRRAARSTGRSTCRSARSRASSRSCRSRA